MLILILAYSGLISIEAETLNWNKGRGYSPFRYASSEGIQISNSSDTLQYDFFKLPIPSDEFSLGFRAKNISGNPSKKYFFYNHEKKKITIDNPHWGFFFTCCGNDTIIYSIQNKEIQTPLEPLPSLDISVYSLSDSSKNQFSISERINPYEGDNLWKIVYGNGCLKLFAGNKDLNQIFEKALHSPITGFGFFAGWGARILISDISAVCSDHLDEDINFMEIADLDTYFSQSEDPLEGYWIIFDRELEESLLKTGGQYSLACVKEGDNYIFLYLDGAVVNSQNWNAGDIKILLHPTPFHDIFNVVWIDAMKEPMHHDIKAQTGDGNTLSIQFPYQSSKIRLRKFPE